jgi:hypothetical protein
LVVLFWAQFFSLLCGICQVTSGNTSCLPQCFVNAVLDETRQLDSNTLGIFDDLPVAKDGIDLVSSDLFRISTQKSQALLLLQRVCTWGLPL